MPTTPGAIAASAEPVPVGLTISREGGHESLLKRGGQGGYGFFFEDINNSGDGGLYAEMLHNRAFQLVDPSDQAAALYAWSALDGTAISVVNDVPGVSSALPNSLKVVPEDGSGAFANEGYWGIKVDSSWTYKASFFARLAGRPSDSTSNLTVTVSLESASGTAFASQDFTGLTADWTEFRTTLKPSASAEDTKNSFVVRVHGAAPGEEVLFAMFSLFPPTFKNRENGMRIDLAETFAACKPTVFRFPGGDDLEGQTVDTRWKWRETIGPLSSRPGRNGRWGYKNTDGLGLLEFLHFIEDMDMPAAVMGVYAGYSVGIGPAGHATHTETVPEAEIAKYVDEALVQIEFVLGGSETEGGKLRAKCGHPEPFHQVKVVEIGNEDNFASDSYAAYRWKAFHSAISKAYPQLKLMATTKPETILDPPEEYTDRHRYRTAKWFSEEGAHLYDDAPRPGPLIFEGEYATTSTNINDVCGPLGTGRLRYSNLEAAVGEGAYMAMIERNSDIVFGATYAPMLEHTARRQWSPNLVLFDAGNVYLSPSYYVQKIFAHHGPPSHIHACTPTTTTSPAPSTLKWVASSLSDNKDTLLFKTANFSPDALALTLTLAGFLNPTRAWIEWVGAKHAGKGIGGVAWGKEENVPGEEETVGLFGPEEIVLGDREDGRAVKMEVKGWAVAVVGVEFSLGSR